MNRNFERVRSLQKRCVECGSYNALEVHHRIFRSQEPMMSKLLSERRKLYRSTTGKYLKPRGIHGVKNLVVLCNRCHMQLHNMNEKPDMRKKYRDSFTCPRTGFNIPYDMPKKRLY